MDERDATRMATYWPYVGLDTMVGCGYCGWRGTYRDTRVFYAKGGPGDVYFAHTKPQPRLLFCPNSECGSQVFLGGQGKYIVAVLVNILRTHHDAYCESIPTSALTTEEFSEVRTFAV